MLKSKFVKPGMICGVIIGVASLILYTATMAPDIGAHDVSEWQATGVSLGIAHGPGSPAYTILSSLLTLVPLGLPAARVTFLSVLMGTAGVVATYIFVLLLWKELLPAVVSACTLALAALWWGHAAVATPYNAVVTVMAIMLIILLRWSRSGNIKLLWLGALIAGLGLAYHPLVMFFLPVPIAGVFLFGPWRTLIRPKPALAVILSFALGLSIYLYLPIRSSTEPLIMYTKIDSVSKFLNHVSASQARGANLRENLVPTPEEIGDRLGEVVYKSYNLSYLIFTLSPLALLFYPGVYERLRQDRRWIGFLAGGMVLQSLLIFLFSDVYSHYYLPFLFYFAIWTGLSMHIANGFVSTFVIARRTADAASMMLVTLYLVMLATGLPNAWDFANHREDRYMRKYVEYVFEKAKPNALILGSWETITAFSYVQKIEGERPDLKFLFFSEQEVKRMLPEIRREYQPAQILISITYNIRSREDIRLYGGPYPLSHKAITYQDLKHGPPYPWSVRLLEIKGDAMVPL